MDPTFHVMFLVWRLSGPVTGLALLEGEVMDTSLAFHLVLRSGRRCTRIASYAWNVLNARSIRYFRYTSAMTDRHLEAREPISAHIPAPNASQSTANAARSQPTPTMSDRWRIVGRPCGQCHGWSIVPMCCTT